MGFGSFSLFHRDHALFVHLAHRLGNQFSNCVIVVGRNRTDLFDLADVTTDLLALFPQVLNDNGYGLVDTPFQVHRVCTGRYVLHADPYDSLSQNGCRSRTVTGIVGSFRGHLFHHLGTHVGHGILEFDLLSDRDTVLGHLRGTEFFIDNHVTAFRAQRNFHCIRQCIHTDFQRLTRFCIIFDLFSHNRSSFLFVR